MEGQGGGRVIVQVRPPWTFWLYFFFPFAIPVTLYVDDRRIGWIWWYRTRTVELDGPFHLSLQWGPDRQSRQIDLRPDETLHLRYRPPATRVSSGKLTVVVAGSPTRTRR